MEKSADVTLIWIGDKPDPWAEALGAKAVAPPSSPSKLEALNAKIEAACARGPAIVIGSNAHELSAALEAGADEVLAKSARQDNFDEVVRRAKARYNARCARDAKVAMQLAREDGEALELLGGAIAGSLSTPLAVAALNGELLRDAVMVLAPLSDRAVELARREELPEAETMIALRSGAPVTSEVESIAGDVLEGVRRAAHVVREVLALAGGSTNVEDSDARSAIVRVESLMRGTIEKIADLVVDVRGAEPLPQAPSRGPEVALPRWQLVHALAALLSNAHRAVLAKGTRGRISIVAKTVGRELQISVEDDGVGMSRAVLRRAFHPFFTTSSRSLGIGLTLAAARARSAGGELSLESNEGRGTIARLRLPVLDPDRAIAAPAASATSKRAEPLS